MGVIFLGAWMLGWFTVAAVLLERNTSVFKSSTENSIPYVVRFGIVSPDSDGNDTLSKDTTVLPLRYKDSGFRFGIQIVPPDDKPYTYHCVFHFPTAPKVVTGEYFEGSVPSTTLQTKEIYVPGGPIVDENWFDPGDPLGDISLEVYINGNLVKTIKYQVIADK